MGGLFDGQGLCRIAGLIPQVAVSYVGVPWIFGGAELLVFRSQVSGMQRVVSVLKGGASIADVFFVFRGRFDSGLSVCGMIISVFDVKVMPKEQVSMICRL